MRRAPALTAERGSTSHLALLASATSRPDRSLPAHPRAFPGSGGKDSCYSMLRCTQHGHTVRNASGDAGRGSAGRTGGGVC